MADTTMFIGNKIALYCKIETVKHYYSDWKPSVWFETITRQNMLDKIEQIW